MGNDTIFVKVYSQKVKYKVIEEKNKNLIDDKI